MGVLFRFKKSENFTCAWSELDCLISKRVMCHSKMSAVQVKFACNFHSFVSELFSFLEYFQSLRVNFSFFLQIVL